MKGTPDRCNRFATTTPSTCHRSLSISLKSNYLQTWILRRRTAGLGQTSRQYRTGMHGVIEKLRLATLWQDQGCGDTPVTAKIQALYNESKPGPGSPAVQAHVLIGKRWSGLFQQQFSMATVNHFMLLQLSKLARLEAEMSRNIDFYALVGARNGRDNFRSIRSATIMRIAAFPVRCSHPAQRPSRTTQTLSW